MAREPIIFDFIERRAYRASEQPKDLAEAMKDTATKARLGRVVRTAVEGLPPSAVRQQQPKT